MKKAYEIRVYGEVQGVLFRANARDQAQRFGLTGYVQNEPDGSVLIEAEGEPELLNRLVDWTREGSAEATVSKVDVKEIEPEHHTTFRVF